MPYPESPNLPPPDDISARYSARASELISDRIEQSGGSISFGEFMQLALYAPGAGYYAAGARKFGAAGDFVTAPEIGAVFGRVVARQCADVLRQIEQGSILEFGAGSGKLAVDVLATLNELDALPRRYRIVEVSADLTQRQQQRLRAEIPGLADRVEWLDCLPGGHRGVIIANEVLDALPVERFRRSTDSVAQQRVVRKAGGFEFEFEPAPPSLHAAVRGIESDIGRQLANGYTSEVSVAAPGWIEDLSAVLDEGIALIFDYGASRREYYADDRSDGWLRCHYRQRAHSDPLILVGIQDITAWVDFSAIARAAASSGFDIAGYATQAMFLTGAGLAQEMRAFESLSVKQQLALSAQIKTLTLPGDMGENIKCLGLSKGRLQPLTAFQTGDRTHTL